MLKHPFTDTALGVGGKIMMLKPSCSHDKFPCLITAKLFDYLIIWILQNYDPGMLKPSCSRDKFPCLITATYWWKCAESTSLILVANLKIWIWSQLKLSHWINFSSFHHNHNSQIYSGKINARFQAWCLMCNLSAALVLKVFSQMPQGTHIFSKW